MCVWLVAGCPWSWLAAFLEPEVERPAPPSSCGLSSIVPDCQHMWFCINSFVNKTIEICFAAGGAWGMVVTIGQLSSLVVKRNMTRLTWSIVSLSIQSRSCHRVCDSTDCCSLCCLHVALQTAAWIIFSHPDAFGLSWFDVTAVCANLTQKTLWNLTRASGLRLICKNQVWNTFKPNAVWIRFVS